MESNNLKRKDLSELTVRFLSEVKRIGVSFYDISKRTGARESMFTKIKGGVQEPSKKFLNTFFECYPEVDKIFVLVGDVNNEDKLMISKGRESCNTDEKNVVDGLTVTERFFKILEAIGIRPSDLLKETDGLASKQSISNAKNGRNEISLKLVCYLCESRENVSTDYILTGRGPMFIEDNSEEARITIMRLSDEVERLRKENEELRDLLEKRGAE